MTRTIMHTITDLLAMPHFPGRWRGDRFLIVVRKNRFRKGSDSWKVSAIHACIGVRGMLLHAGDSTETLLSRIDLVKDR